MKKIFTLFALIVALSFSTDLKSQPPDPGGGGGSEPGCLPPPCIPIDGGLAWLLVAGVAYGGKKVYELNQKEEN